MTTNLEIPGYKTVFPSKVWKKSGIPILNETKKVNAPLTEILYLENYKVPSVDEIVENICYTAGSINLKPYKNRDLQDNLIQIITEAFSPIGIQNLTNRNPQLINTLKKTATHEHDYPSFNYIHIDSALVPNPIINSNAQDLEQGKELAYLQLINSNVGWEEWDAWIMLDKPNNILPKLSRLEALFEERVTSSDILTIISQKSILNHAYSRISLIYGALLHNENKIQDTSSQFLDISSIRAINNFTNGYHSARENNISHRWIFSSKNFGRLGDPRLDN